MALRTNSSGVIAARIPLSRAAGFVREWRINLQTSSEEITRSLDRAWVLLLRRLGVSPHRGLAALALLAIWARKHMHIAKTQRRRIWEGLNLLIRDLTLPERPPVDLAVLHGRHKFVSRHRSAH